MVTEGVGRLVVVGRTAPTRPTGILTRSDVLGAHRRRLEGTRDVHAHLPLGRLLGRGAIHARRADAEPS
jgi:chloride channel protein, CIC family